MTTKRNPIQYQGVIKSDEEAGNLSSEFDSSHHSMAFAGEFKSSSPSPLAKKSVVVWGGIVLIAFIVLIGLVANINHEVVQSSGRNGYLYSPGATLRLSSLNCISCSSQNQFQLYSNEQTNKMYARVSDRIIGTNTVVFMIDQLTTGVGKRELYWDAGMIVSNDMVTFRKEGSGKLVLCAVQNDFRGNSDLMKRSFPSPVLWTFEVLDTNSYGDLVDVTDFLLQPIGAVHNNDLRNVIASSFGAQYVYEVDPARSGVHSETCEVNSYRAILDRTVTYVLSDLPPPSGLGKAITVSVRKTFLLPDEYSPSEGSSRFAPRPHHPMSGFNSVQYMNESTLLLEPRRRSLTVHHRLTAAAEDDTYSQIVYYIDGEAPAGIREALVEGIAWWDEAFQHAGYPKGTFVAKTIARTEFDPYDLHSPRRNFVEWVNRDLRAYSLGIRIEDPRTAEIMKGHVRIENLRMRQDALIAEALLGPFEDTTSDSTHTGKSLVDILQARLLTNLSEATDVGGGFGTPIPRNRGHGGAVKVEQAQLVDDIMGAIMQRVRQLGAHEVGHTLGLTHNFAGSASALGFSSVMDYPPPIVTIDPTGSKLVLNNMSYATGIGFFDKVAIDFGYRPLDPSLSFEAQQELLDDLIQQAAAQGYMFLTDQDSAVSGVDWRDTQWDSGADPVVALRTALQVRALAMRKLESNAVLSEFSASSDLQELFPLVYLWHRYEVEAVAKMLGGSLFQYGLKRVTKLSSLNPISGPQQMAALDQLIACLDPKILAISAAVSSRLLPIAFGYIPDIGGSADLMATRSGSGTFDELDALEIGANLAVSAIFSAPRLERLAVQAQHNASLPSLAYVFARLTGAVFAVNATADLVSGQCGSLHGGQVLASIAAQSVLVNAYMSVVDTSSTGYSLLVRSICKYHVQNVLLPAIAAQTNALTAVAQNHEHCEDSVALLQAHYSGLTSAASSGKVFMSVSAPPLGPPI